MVVADQTTGLLSGEFPAEAVVIDQKRVLRTVERQVADLEFPVRV